jgi:hypothetical protein
VVGMRNKLQWLICSWRKSIATQFDAEILPYLSILSADSGCYIITLHVLRIELCVESRNVVAALIRFFGIAELAVGLYLPNNTFL